MASRDATQKHIVNGGAYPFENSVPLSDFESESRDHGDPMQFGGGSNITEPQSVGSVQGANLTQAVGLASAASPGDMIDMSSASDNSDNKPGNESYGPRFTGR